MPNGLIFIEDAAGGEPPFPAPNAVIRHTPSCISVVALHEVDGEAELILGSAEEVVPGFELAFDGALETPSRKVILTTVPGEVLLQARVPTEKTRIRVWRSDPQWPEQVVVGWG